MGHVVSSPLPRRPGGAAPRRLRQDRGADRLEERGDRRRHDARQSEGQGDGDRVRLRRPARSAREFNNEVFPAFKAKYIDTGKIHYVFREIPRRRRRSRRRPASWSPAAPARTSISASSTPCSTARTQMFQSGDMRGTLLGIAQSAGLSEAQFNACINDTAALKALNDRVQTLHRQGRHRFHADLRHQRQEAGRRADAGQPRQGDRRRPVGEARAAVLAFPAAPPFGLQVLRRADRVPHRARPDRRRRPERLRQVEHPGSDALGDGRKLRQGHARRRDGRRHLLRHRRAALAQPRRGRAVHRQRRPRRARPSTPTTRCWRWCAASTAAPARPSASTAARCARATCSCCSPTPPPGPIRRRWCARGRSAN